MPTKDWDKILVDTSAWIEFFRKREPYFSAVGGWMDENRICCMGIILAELIQGVKTEEELTVFEDFLHVFEFLPESKELWGKAGKLSFHLIRKGFRPGLSDCFIAVVAYENQAGLLTLDKHFREIKKVLDISLVQI